MNKNNDNKLVMNIRITDTKEFNKFKDITYKILSDERIDYLIRDEYWNKVMSWLLDSRNETECSCKEKFKIICQTCGSNDVSILEDYDCDDHSYVYGYYLECNVCKEHNLW